MKITDILENRFTYSVEILPSEEVFGSGEVLEEAKIFKDLADFSSVTSGAGGNRKRCGTISLSYLIKDEFKSETIPHVTCLESTIPDINEKLEDIHNLGMINLLALRGDPPGKKKIDPDYQPPGFRYASDLIDYIAQFNRFCIGAAAHPEGYPKDPDEKNKIKWSVDLLKIKEDCGANFAITQMVFDANVYFNFIEQAEKQGVTIPIIPLVWPVERLKQCKFVIDKFGVTVPFLKEVKQSSDRAEFLFNKMTQLCRDLKSGGAPGIHFTVYDNAELVKRVIEYIK